MLSSFRCLGALAAWQTSNWWWLVGGVVLLANWPFTLLGIMPTNNKLMAIHPASATSDVHQLVKTWGLLHAGRSAMGAVTTLVLLTASLQERGSALVAQRREMALLCSSTAVQSTRLLLELT